MKIVYFISLVALAIAGFVLSICSPEVLSKNRFLDGFINQEIVNIQAVIMTISIATIATIYIWFNELEDKHKQKAFGAARREINQSAFYLIGLFLAQLACLIVRSLPVFQNDTALSLFNTGSMLLLVCSVFTLVDIMGVVRALTPTD